jgi:cobalamin biosynthetic protein CobC
MTERTEKTGSRGVAGDAVYHGGNLAVARQRFPTAPAPWLDLSTGINPVPYPVGEIPAEAWTRLPEPADLARLEAVAARVYGARPEDVVAAPGTQALIQLLPRLALARRVGVLGLTYEEHGHVWAAAGAAVEVVEHVEALAGFDAAVIVNPNNPDGRLVHGEEIEGVAEAIGRRGGLLVVDEAFMDVVRPSESVARDVPAATVVLRSFGKTYGLAGLRLGFAVARPALGGRLRAMLGPWAVPGPAIHVGARALADTAWLEATYERLTDDMARLDAILYGAGFEVLGGTPLYRLARHPRASLWFERLGQAGILARPFAARPDWLRFGLPAGAANWRRLELALAGAPAL